LYEGIKSLVDKSEDVMVCLESNGKRPTRWIAMIERMRVRGHLGGNSGMLELPDLYFRLSG
jgi:predicted alpha/beta hydrolase family esterase